MLAQGFFLKFTPVAPEVRASLSLPRESDKERPGSPPDPRAEGLLRKARPFGAGRPSRGDQSPHVPPCPPGGGFQFPQPGGRRKLRACGGHPAPARPLFAAESGLTFPPWLGFRKSARPGAQKAAWNRCESSGGPGCRAPREARRFAELPTALPGGERRLGTGRETSGGPSRSHPAQPVALEGSRGLPGQSLATFF